MINVIDVFSRYTKDYSVIFYKKKGQKNEECNKISDKKSGKKCRAAKLKKRAKSW